MSIKVYPRGKVEVVVPRRTSARSVQAFIAEHQDWIRNTRSAFAKEHVPEPFQLPTRIALPAVGRIIGVSYRPSGSAHSVRYRQKGDILFLSGKVSDARLCVAALKRWLAGVAREHIAPQLHSLAQISGNSYRRLRVAGQKTCWGSHSSTGTISVNYCLLFLQPALLRYLLIHELCHARHMNHSRKFWSEVKRYEPGYRTLDRTLSGAWKDIPAWVGIY
ncbi:MAG TPA: SprT family zinc-dependent metalloprotease [Woeseiaceae bacterium]|nr:SprT family zinc-dependent metalloprotease [Woeseiaceae bacterium]